MNKRCNSCKHWNAVSGIRRTGQCCNFWSQFFDQYTRCVDSCKSCEAGNGQEGEG